MHSNCFAKITALNRGRLVLVKQKHSSTRTPGESVDIVFDMLAADMSDSPRVDIHDVRKAVNCFEFRVVAPHRMFTNTSDSLAGRLRFRCEHNGDPNFLTNFKLEAFSNELKSVSFTCNTLLRIGQEISFGDIKAEGPRRWPPFDLSSKRNSIGSPWCPIQVRKAKAGRDLPAVN